MHTQSLPHFPHPPLPPHNHPAHGVYPALLQHSSAPRTDTDLVLATSIRAQHPQHTLTTIPAFQCRLLAFAAAGNAVATLDEDVPSHTWRSSDQPGVVSSQVWFARYRYEYSGQEYIMYTAAWEHGYGMISLQYLLSPVGEEGVDALIVAATEWDARSDNEIWVFDHGEWSKNQGLWEEIQKARWEDVILDPELKKRMVGDVEGFFGSKEVYRKYSVPWKRGIIFHGPPGNGKTISIKALMHTLSEAKVPTLYVKTLHSFWGEETSVAIIFEKARSVAPCLLVFEDLDSLISDEVRSYFLNEVDGLSKNDGVCILGSTNHLERLDPGIAKRPSRFDRKYLFPLPAKQERIAYCQYWRNKLADNKEIEFPEKLCNAIADITNGFSFAYLKEAFVASLLIIAGGGVEEEEHKNGLEKLLLWRVIRDQIKNLRKEMGGRDDDD